MINIDMNVNQVNTSTENTWLILIKPIHDVIMNTHIINDMRVVDQFTIG